MSFRKMRRMADLTQEQVAEKLGITTMSVYLWEKGQTLPRASLLPTIAELYGCTVDELLKKEK